MIKPELPANEEARLAALRRYQVMDTLAEQTYDDITRLASFICQTPISLISLLDEKRQWFKSVQGLNGVRETPRDMAFCAHAILQPDQTLVVPDALRDARFAGNALVQDLPNIRFYAGSPLVTSSGEALGTLCVIDSIPRELTDEQIQALEALSRQVMAQLEARLSERKMHEASLALQNSEARFHAFMDNAPMVAYMKDAEGRMLYTNRQSTKCLHKTSAELLGKIDAELWPPEMAAQLRKHDLQVLSGDSLVELEEKVPTPDGTWQYWRAFKFPLLQPDGSKILGGISLDITERKFYERQMAEYQLQLETMVERLEEMATTDAMTGLKNKGAFEMRVREEWERARRYRLPLTLLTLDVDKFKQYNDSFGHPAGDEVLKQVAGILRSQARPSDCVARTGGEEFSVILANTNLEGAFIVAERLRRTIEDAAWTQRAVTASIGLACARPEFEDVTLLIECADRALYHAKQTGRNRVTLGASCH